MPLFGEHLTKTEFRRFVELAVEDAAPHASKFKKGKFEVPGTMRVYAHPPRSKELANLIFEHVAFNAEDPEVTPIKLGVEGKPDKFLGEHSIYIGHVSLPNGLVRLVADNADTYQAVTGRPNFPTYASMPPQPEHFQLINEALKGRQPDPIHRAVMLMLTNSAETMAR